MPTLTMKGLLRECLLLAYRTPAESVAKLLPPPLRLLQRGDWAFWNVVVCDIEKMRPVFAPRFAGISYLHVAFRLYAWATAADGSRVEGLYFVRSDADDPLVCLGGGLMSDFAFHRSPVKLEAGGGAWKLSSAASDPAARMSLVARDASAHRLADGSPFARVDEAAKTLKYSPMGLSVGRGGRRLRLAEVLRREEDWVERPLEVEEARWGFFESIGQRDLTLELATRAEPIDYRWRLGRSLALR